MSWTESTPDDTTTEWERSDGHANIRMRRRHDGSFAVRFDRLFQAPEGQFYKRETAESEPAAKAIIEAWQTEFDVEQPSGR
ncbi:hypothetical protein SAMN04487950_2444 [Halogranum rubrum]|uniref:Uncharacterized protein n=2 Tax=Halogranum rubrum TaxID=553466 RepID=A0A1I4EZI4_9EURY|nr:MULTISPECIES: hypothetical protein [Halogranum]EJN60173.1 hypothetical protein HSB1_07760 [Halogranum salarium B-1]SFL09987.1 hypothetical protein SAMN04487950_2444 [Halogranum rubrum]